MFSETKENAAPRPSASRVMPRRSQMIYLFAVFAAFAAAMTIMPTGKADERAPSVRRESKTASPGAALPQAGASVRVRVGVPSSMATSPFNTERFLNVPANFAVSVYARVGGARFMAIAPNGDLLVSHPGSGSVKIVRPSTNGGDPTVSNFVTGLRNPHDIVFHSIADKTYVYIAESHQINRYLYTFGATTPGTRQIVVANLPDNSTPELQGSYGHQLKNIALDSNHKLYVSIASTCNVCQSDTVSDPVRAAMYQYNHDGTGRRLFARGLRNAEGLAFIPDTNILWVVVNNRDQIPYPFQNDFNGDGSNDYGKIMSGYVDNHPVEEFTRVRDGGNYGWPFCNPNQDTASGLNDMPFDLDYDMNRYGEINCGAMDRISKGIQAHSAPLGFSFLQNTNFPIEYRNGAAIAYHGSWNRTQRTGYKVAYFPWNSQTQTPGDQIDLVTGWVNSDGQNVWGRPVDAIVDHAGSLLISDDQAGTIYKLTSTQPSTNFALLPTTDTYVKGSAPTINYGGASELQVKRTLNPGSGKGRQAYLRFDTAQVTGSITRATLKVYGALNAVTGINRNIPVAVFPVSNQTWLESAVVWNDKPAPNEPTPLAQAIVTDATPRWYEFDVTGFINAERAAGRFVTGVLLRNMERGETGDYYTAFDSREGINQPRLVIER